MKKIFVGNLDFGATDSTVRSLFEQYGNVESASVVTDRDTGRSRGFAFVEMADEDAERAIGALNGWTLLMGQVPMAAAQDNLFDKVSCALRRQ